jgi:anti-sigma factor RsiW
MNPGTERDLLRRLTGGLSEEEAAGLARRMEGDPGLARDWQRLERSWQELELPQSAPAPPGFATRVMAEVRSEARGGAGLSLGQAPFRVRVLAAAALAAGLGLGVFGAQWSQPGQPNEGAAGSDDVQEMLVRPTSLADSYWSALGGDDGGPTDPTDPTDRIDLGDTADAAGEEAL